MSDILKYHAAGPILFTLISVVIFNNKTQNNTAILMKLQGCIGELGSPTLTNNTFGDGLWDLVGKTPNV